METNEYIQIALFIILLIALAPVLGTYMAKVFMGERNALSPLLGRAERFIYKIAGVDAEQDMNWRGYLLALLLFNGLGLVFLFLVLSVQQWLPLNPQHIANMSWHTALNTAISYVTNTNWQSYAGETELSYLSQMIGLTVQNFLSAATGMTVLLALVRGINAHSSGRLGNFWVDITRSTLYILLPLSLIMAVVLVGQGVIQNFNEYTQATTLQGDIQTIPQGPAASQIAIKQLGTNGGGFFGANSAHPFENPTPFSNFLEMLAILLIPSSLVYAYGKMVNSIKHGRVVFMAMFMLFISGLSVSLYSEYTQTGLENGLSMEGKEVRNGVANSILFAETTTAVANGSVNAMHSSLSPLAGMITMVNMMLGEVIFGGAGAGLYGMVIYIVLTVFIAGLMVGRTPEYLGKKIEAFDIKMAIMALLAPAMVILLFSAAACALPEGLAGLSNKGPHGLSEILYAFSSAAGNNGSAFAGLKSSTVFYDVMVGLGMLIGRFGVIIPVLAMAGSLSGKKKIPVSQGTLNTENWLFAGLLVVIILIVGGLTFFPALSLGPVAEHLLLQQGVFY